MNRAHRIRSKRTRHSCSIKKLFAMAFWGMEFWETFLAPLSIREQAGSATRSVTLSPLCGSLVETFKNALDGQRQEQELEAPLRIQNDIEIQNARADLMVSSNNVQDFQALEAKWRLYLTAVDKMEKDNKKSVHCNSSGSAWTISMLQCHIQRENIVFVSPTPNLNSLFLFQSGWIASSIKAICGNDYVDQIPLYSFNNLGNTTESDTRMILDAILQPLCLGKGLKIRTEETLKCQSPRSLGNGRNLLPTNKYDYILYDNTDRPIGVVEAKRRRGIKKDSVAQLLVQLLLLSAEDPMLLYFGVLSDAYEFIFAGVKQNKVIFFQANEYVLEIDTWESWGDLDVIVWKLSWIIDQAIQSRLFPLPFTNVYHLPGPLPLGGGGVAPLQ